MKVAAWMMRPVVVDIRSNNVEHCYNVLLLAVEAVPTNLETVVQAGAVVFDVAVLNGVVPIVVVPDPVLRSCTLRLANHLTSTK